MRTFQHPTCATIEAIHEEVLDQHGGAEGIRDRGLLESAVAAPQATMSGEPLLDDAFEIAAAYLFHLCQNHPFVDGNKRTALATALVFLTENGFLADEVLDVDRWEALTVSVADGKLGRPEIAKAMRKLLSVR